VLSLVTSFSSAVSEVLEVASDVLAEVLELESEGLMPRSSSSCLMSDCAAVVLPEVRSLRNEVRSLVVLDSVELALRSFWSWVRAVFAPVASPEARSLSSVTRSWVSGSSELVEELSDDEERSEDEETALVDAVWEVLDVVTGVYALSSSDWRTEDETPVVIDTERSLKIDCRGRILGKELGEDRMPLEP
jgi:hypothetical protein